MRPRVFARLDERLFRAWQAKDEAARADAWVHIWDLSYSVAVALCRGFAPDEHTAQEWASHAITGAWIDIERQLQQGLRWDGDPEFVGLLRAHVTYRCKDRYRAYWRLTSHFEDFLGVPDDQRAERLDALATIPPTQEVKELAAARTHEAIGGLVSRLTAEREICRSSPALVEILDAMLAYVLECCARAVVGDSRLLTLDELIPLVNRDVFDASMADMNQFILERLKINRNTLDTRRKQIRRRVEQTARDETDRRSHPRTL